MHAHWISQRHLGGILVFVSTKGIHLNFVIFSKLGLQRIFFDMDGISRQGFWSFLASISLECHGLEVLVSC